MTNIKGHKFQGAVRPISANEAKRVMTVASLGTSIRILSSKTKNDLNMNSI